MFHWKCDMSGTILLQPTISFTVKILCELVLMIMYSWAFWRWTKHQIFVISESLSSVKMTGLQVLFLSATDPDSWERVINLAMVEKLGTATFGYSTRNSSRQQYVCIRTTCKIMFNSNNRFFSVISVFCCIPTCVPLQSTAYLGRQVKLVYVFSLIGSDCIP